ncbi:MAG: 16S rRNA (cytosine(1402)-N(4))-methyltransferase RsmH [Candidatus Aminicenantes bacterium]|nr:16S rRNA (cytosine(1402)-N(4))-methyltransferase RsmH [Candidatus Aminicenantes bacterium]
MESRHYPVMSNEIVDLLRDVPPGWMIDGTIGLGGHALRVLRELPHLRVLGMDMDSDSLKEAGRRLDRWKDRVVLVQANYTTCLDSTHIRDREVTAVLVDPGISSWQLQDAGRGFSHNLEGPLDMRKDRGSGITAADVINTWSLERLEVVFREYGEVRRAGELAKRVIETRLFTPIRTTTELKQVVEKVFGSRFPRGVVHPAARVFQALRICVNRELDGVETFILRLPDVLKSGGRILFLSFHSIEDRVVKQTLRRLQAEGRVTCLKPFPMLPQETEVLENPPSHSARLRVAEVA